MDVDCLVQNLVGAISKENKDDLDKVKGYFNTVVRDKSSKEGGLWKQYYEARKPEALSSRCRRLRLPGHSPRFPVPPPAAFH